MKTTRSFDPMTNRYKFDFNLCSVEKGFAQVDTSQDASYFGTWANPVSLQIVTYCEGDITLEEAESKEEFATAIRFIKQWNEEHDHRFKGIDTGLGEKGEAIRKAFQDLGLDNFLYHWPN